MSSYPLCAIGGMYSYRETVDRFLPGLKVFYDNPSPFYQKPFRIFGNLWYVGDKKVCSHLIDTGDGLILFDTGYGCSATPLLLDAIREAGFDVKDLRYIIHSHGHFDHFGSGELLRKLSGATVCMGAEDTRLLRENPNRSLCQLMPGMEVCWPDWELRDGDHIRLGNTDITCLLTPGHTCGTMTFLFDVTDGTQTYKAGYLGGAGFLTIYKEHNLEYNLPMDKNDRLLESVKQLQQYDVDIHLGNHPHHNCTLEKRQFMLDNPGTNPFIDRRSWQVFLDTLEKQALEFKALGY